MQGPVSSLSLVPSPLAKMTPFGIEEEAGVKGYQPTRGGNFKRT